MSDLPTKFANYDKDKLITECIWLTERNKQLHMRLAAVKTIVNSSNPTCSEKLRKLLSGCEWCEGDN